MRFLKKKLKLQIWSLFAYFLICQVFQKLILSKMKRLLTRHCEFNIFIGTYPTGHFPLKFENCRFLGFFDFFHRSHQFYVHSYNTLTNSFVFFLSVTGLHAGKKRKLKEKRFDSHFGRKSVKKSVFLHIKSRSRYKKIENGKTPFSTHCVIRIMLNFQESPKSSL